MNMNVSFNFVSQMAHWSFAAFITLATARLHPIPHYYLIAITLAGIKEFWYDLKFETPDAMGSGGIKGSIEDFLYYMLGLLIAFLILR